MDNEAGCDERVRAEWGCPECGERRVDWLIWQDDTVVRCESCGREYIPGQREGGAA